MRVLLVAAYYIAEVIFVHFLCSVLFDCAILKNAGLYPVEQNSSSSYDFNVVHRSSEPYGIEGGVKPHFIALSCTIPRCGTLSREHGFKELSNSVSPGGALYGFDRVQSHCKWPSFFF